MRTLPIEMPGGLPGALEERSGSDDLPRWILEAIVIEAVREGVVPRGYSGELLRLGFHEREDLYARRGLVYDYAPEDLDAERGSR